MQIDKADFVIVGAVGGLMEAAIGFEPMHGGFADLSLNHLGTPPRVGRCRDRTHSTITRGKTHQLSKWAAEHPHLKGGDYFGAAHGQK
jgi:hypothetical protein